MTANTVAAIFQAPPLPSLGTFGEVEVSPSDANNDFEESRRNLITIMETTKAAIIALSSLAQASQDPDVFDKLDKFIKNYAAQNEQLLRMYRLRALNKEDASKTGPTNVTGEHVDARTQNVFVGTPADLAKVLESIKASKSEIT